MCYGLVSYFTYFCFILKQKSVIYVLLLKNKRAHRALGRSHEEKVMGHSGAVNRKPLMLSTKYW